MSTWSLTYKQSIFKRYHNDKHFWPCECVMQTYRQIIPCSLQQKPTVCTHARAHTFNGPFSGTTLVSWYQKGKTNLDFTEARDSEWQWHQLGHMQVCTSLQTDNHASTSLLSLLQDGCPSCWGSAAQVHSMQNSLKNNSAMEELNSDIVWQLTSNLTRNSRPHSSGVSCGSRSVPQYEKNFSVRSVRRA